MIARAMKPRTTPRMMPSFLSELMSLEWCAFSGVLDGAAEVVEEELAVDADDMLAVEVGGGG
jgi:hypothetical protein